MYGSVTGCSERPSDRVYIAMATQAPPEAKETKQPPKRQRQAQGLITVAIIALVLQSGMLFLALFGPNLPYVVPRPMASPTDSEQFIRTLAAITGSRVTWNKRFDVLANGEKYYPAELDAIRSAKKSVAMEAYIFQDGGIGTEVIDALAASARRGVKVHLIADAIGSAALTKSDLKRLTEAGGRHAWYHPLRWYTWPRLNNRTHRELLVVDGQVGFIGGAGIADHWAKMVDGQPRWRDTMVRVEGQAVVDMQGTFVENWLEAAGEILTGDAYFEDPPEPGAIPAVVVRSSPTKGRSTPARILFQTLLASARKSIRITTPYFLPDRSLREELVRAIQRGVSVEIIVPGPTTDHTLTRTSSRRLYGDVLKAKGFIYEYQPTMMHAKILVVDSLWSVVGSTNMDPRSFSLNDEVNLAVRDAQLAGELERDFAEDLRQSRKVDYEQWRKRPIWERAGELIGSIIERQQ